MYTFKNPDVWKQNLAYQIGDFVLYDGTVYMSIKPVPAGTSMSADYWIAYDEGAIVPTGEISITENGEVDVSEYATANVNVEGGGGGGGDLTTASLTVVNNSEGGSVTIECAIAGSPEIEPQGSFTSVYAEPGQSTTADAILYKGIALAYCTNSEGYSIAIVGDAEMDAETGLITISGDCTLTVTDDGSLS